MVPEKALELLKLSGINGMSASDYKINCPNALRYN